MVANTKVVRRTSAQVVLDAQEGLQSYRLRRRIPVMGVIDATGEPGQERIRMYPYATEDVAIDIPVINGVVTGDATVDVVAHEDVTFEYLPLGG